jgi:uncharacterized protein (TIGR03503 family)
MKISKPILLITKVISIVLLLVGLAQAQVDMAAPAPIAVIQSKLIPDVRVIIDISGSMKQNDPQNLRRPALELLVRLFPDNAKAGVWTFGQWVNMLVAHKNVDDLWRSTALDQAQNINSVALRTNILEALKKAVDDVDNLDPRYKTHLILLTDGVVDVSSSAKKNKESRDKIINELLPKLVSAGVSIHTVALSNNADRELMERLSIETNGLSAIAETAEDLAKIFLQAFDAAAPAEQVPLQGNKFLIDPSIDEYTALIFRKKDSDGAILVSPTGEKYTMENHTSDIKWHRQGDYDLITVTRPQKGEWSLVADLKPDSRVTIVSNLSLQVNTLPKSIFVDSETKITAALRDQGNTIVKPDFLRLVDLDVAVTRRKDSLLWDMSLSDADRAPSRGVFTSVLTMLGEAGVYDVVVDASGKTFKRRYSQTVKVHENFEVETLSTSDAVPKHQLTVFAKNPSINTMQTNVSAVVIGPEGREILAEAQVIDNRGWALELDTIRKSGRYEVTVKAKGQYSNGAEFEYTTPIPTIEHVVQGEELKLIEPESKPEPLVVPENIVAPANPEPKADPPVIEEEAISMTEIAFYAGIGLGNLLIFGLGYAAYKAVKGPASNETQADDDFDDDEDFPDEEEDVAEDEGSFEDLDDSDSTSTPALSAPQDVDDLLDDIEDFQIEEKDSDFLEEETDAVLDEFDEIDVDELDLDLDEDPAQDVDDELIDIDDILDLPDDAIDIDSLIEDEK